MHWRRLWQMRNGLIAGLALAAIAVHLVFQYGLQTPTAAAWTLYLVLGIGGMPLVAELAVKLVRRDFGSDLLAGISIVTSILLGEYLAGTFVVLMLSGGATLEAFAVRRASAVLEALAQRMPFHAHLKTDSRITDVPLEQVRAGDVIVVFPHEACPVDGVVVEGHGVMDEAYLTGEPYMMSKTPGSEVISGAINGETALTIRATRRADDSRYAKIMKVMQETEQHRPRLRRLGDQLGAWYTPLALSAAAAAWLFSGDSLRFLGVLVVATPCPLLIAIPVAILGSISLCAQRGIVVRNPAVLEQIDLCTVAIFDKTGTLTYGEPRLVEQLCAEGFDRSEVLALTASLERYSKHPLAAAVLHAADAEQLALSEAERISEPPGQGLRGVVAGRTVQVTSRKQLARSQPEIAAMLPPMAGGLECVILIDGRYAATYRFRDEPRAEGGRFIHHLGPKHHFERVLLVSGDRESEVRYLADMVGIREIYAEQSPEQKVEIVRRETAQAKTVFLGDGINDAPALTAATVGVAFGQKSDVTSEAADVVIMDTSLERFDEFLHISRRMRQIALLSAVGGMVLSMGGMVAAGFGWLHPVGGAITQEAIDVAAIANALRAAWPPRQVSDFATPSQP